MHNKKLFRDQQLKEYILYHYNANFKSSDNRSILSNDLKEPELVLSSDNTLKTIQLKEESVSRKLIKSQDKQFLIYYIPFQGDGNLFYCNPSYCHSPNLLGHVDNNILVLQYHLHDPEDIHHVHRVFQIDLSKLQSCLRYMNIEIRNRKNQNKVAV